jgi:hypothetical protein
MVGYEGLVPPKRVVPPAPQWVKDAVGTHRAEFSTVDKTFKLIKWPSEPPLGSLLESLSQEPSFQLERLKDGWHQSDMPRVHPWSTVVKLWLPARVIRWGSTES